MQAGTLEPEAAFLNASLIPDVFPVLAAAHKTLIAKSRESLTTRTPHSELVYNYSGSKHITESLKRCGIADSSNYVLAARFNASPDEMEAVGKLINGKEIDLDELESRANQAQIQKPGTRHILACGCYYMSDCCTRHLVRRKHSCSHACKLIKGRNESCKLAKKVWNLFKAEGSIPNCQFHDIIRLIEDMTKQQNNVEKESVAALLWVIWNARNKWIFEGKQEAPAMLVARAESVVESFKNVSQYDGSRPNQKREGKDIQGHSIPNGWLKVNVDAAVNVEKQVAGLGVVITDGNRNCITAAINTSRYFGNVAMAEAAAVKWGLLVALRAGGGGGGWNLCVA
ncbi:ekc/keops complex subunit tprkb [Citrus sinensis]|nr:ekc/keops complex subunit tprkb [Citrus sinensis]